MEQLYVVDVTVSVTGTTVVAISADEDSNSLPHCSQNITPLIFL